MLYKEEGRKKAMCFIKRTVERESHMFYKKEGRKKTMCFIKRKLERKLRVL